MSVLKLQKNTRTLIMVLAALALLLLAEPTLARKDRGRKAKTRSNTSKSQKVEKSSRQPRSKQIRKTERKSRTRPAVSAKSTERRKVRRETAVSRKPRSVRRTLNKTRVARSTPVVRRSRGTKPESKIISDSHKRPRRHWPRKKPPEPKRKKRPSPSLSTSTRPSLSTRPARERSQHVRPSTEKSQHRIIDRNLKETVFRRRSSPVISRRKREITRRFKSPYRRRDSGRVRYREHRDVARKHRHRRRHDHVFRDRHRRLVNRIIWPRYRFILSYRWGPRVVFRYTYPYYHRKYVFVSLGGYWPIDYRYVRYYWYGWHPYYWSGYSPIASEVGGDTYNYYTYNYNYGDDETGQVYSTEPADGIRPVDHTTFADVRERMAQQAVEVPEDETQADRYFGQAVEAFEADDYGKAADKFAYAMKLADDDMVLPFAYAQALFADEKYTKAAEVLRSALKNVTPEKEGVFYPRGLYKDEDVLLEQIEKLSEKAEIFDFDADIQLLLGYQLLGIGEFDQAIEPLQKAGEDLQNADAAFVLLDLLEKIRTDENPGIDK